MTLTSLRDLRHLARRFFGSVRPGPPSTLDDHWARQQLGAGEVELWDRMSNPDRRHAVGVARSVVAELGPAADRPVVAAALLHDSGKTVSGLGTFARVGATLVWAVVDRRRAESWLDSRWEGARRLAQYGLHPEIGAELLDAAGADRLTVDWARQHHLPPERWTVPHHLAAVLHACDMD